MNSLKHVAIIMDGNGRWGLKKGKSRNFGHRQGVKSVEKINQKVTLIGKIIQHDKKNSIKMANKPINLTNFKGYSHNF